MASVAVFCRFEDRVYLKHGGLDIGGDLSRALSH
jgi:hypothetical protein